jgi:hypothetical protein
MVFSGFNPILEMGIPGELWFGVNRMPKQGSAKMEEILADSLKQADAEVKATLVKLRRKAEKGPSSEIGQEESIPHD